MGNEVETQKERSDDGTAIQRHSKHYLPREGSENNRFQNNLLQIQFYHVLYVPSYVPELKSLGTVSFLLLLVCASQGTYST